MSGTTEAPPPSSQATLTVGLYAEFTVVSLIIVERNRKHLAME